MSNAKKLDPFQLQAIEKIQNEHRAGRRTLLCLPTGTGKTRVAVNYAHNDFVKRSRPVLWIAHTEELLQQAYETFLGVGVSSSRMARRFGGLDELKYASQPLVTFVSNGGKLGPAEAALIIVDEAHHAAGRSYTEKLSLYRAFAQDGARVLGLTATPYRLDEGQVVHLTSFGFSKPRVPIFESVAYEKSFCELVDLERVAPFLREQVETRLRFRPKVRNGEVSSETLEELNTPGRNRTIVEAWCAHRRRWGMTIVFVGTQKHAKSLARAFGPVASFLTSENAANREQVLSRFRRGEVPVLVNVRMLGEGIDVPDVQTVIIARPTMSPMLYIQMVGRGSRITPTKRFFHLVDVHDQLGEFEHYLAGVDDLAERKPGLLEANAKRARAAQALALDRTRPRPETKASNAVEPAAVGLPAPVSILTSEDAFRSHLLTLLDAWKAGRSDSLLGGTSLAGWWETTGSSGAGGEVLPVLAAEVAGLEYRFFHLNASISAGEPPTTQWHSALAVTPEKTYSRFAETMIARGVTARFVALGERPDNAGAVLLRALEQGQEASAFAVREPYNPWVPSTWDRSGSDS